MGGKPTSNFNEAMTLIRILQKIPTSYDISSSQIRDLLLADGYPIAPRTLQRYLKSLTEAEIFGIRCNDRGKPFGYRRLVQPGRFLTTPLSTTESLLIRLAQETLKHRLPKTMLESSQALFEAASEQLGDHSPDRVQAKRWLSKVESIPNTLPRIPPAVKPLIFDVITECLFKGVMIRCEYRKAKGTIYRGLLTPLGLVQQSDRLYLVALPEDVPFEEGSIRHYALHRFKKAENTKMLLLPLEGFDLKTYIAKSRLFNVIQKERVLFRMVFKNAYLFNDLLESPLAREQWEYDYQYMHNHQYVVDAVVDDSPQLRAFVAMWLDPHNPITTLTCPVEAVDWDAYQRASEADKSNPPSVPALKVKMMWGYEPDETDA